MSARWSTYPDSDRHGAPFGRELLVYLLRSCIADISLGGQDLLDRTGERSLETKRRELLKRYYEIAFDGVGQRPGGLAGC